MTSKINTTTAKIKTKKVNFFKFFAFSFIMQIIEFITPANVFKMSELQLLKKIIVVFASVDAFFKNAQNDLNKLEKLICLRLGLNQRPLGFQPNALPTELLKHIYNKFFFN